VLAAALSQAIMVANKGADAALVASALVPLPATPGAAAEPATARYAHLLSLMRLPNDPQGKPGSYLEFWRQASMAPGALLEVLQQQGLAAGLKSRPTRPQIEQRLCEALLQEACGQ